jgi:Mg2+ and Co2+ transporter CorA
MGPRCLQTLHKIRSVINFITIGNSFNSQDNHFTVIVEDYEHLAGLVNTYGRRLETMVPAVISLVQIAGTCRSLKEATNVTRLINLALLIVPLSFVTGLFSMNDTVTTSRFETLFCCSNSTLCCRVLLCSSSPIHQYQRAFSKVLVPESRHKDRGVVMLCW